MKLADFVVPEATILDLRASTKEDAAREIVGALCSAGCLHQADAEAIAQAVLRREGLGTTGVGEGVAFPEARHSAVPRLLGSVALSRRGIDFDAVDGKPVHILLLVGCPWNRPGDFLRAAEIISCLLRDEDFRDRLRRARTREEIAGLLAEADRETLWETSREAHRQEVRTNQRQDQPPA
jgi:mannitol/fructose-specific phosphotransferase system IIA component (Ntr-type)